MKPRCICGCGRKATQRHHAITQHQLRKVVSAEHLASGKSGPRDIVRELALCNDSRNLVPIHHTCHAAHHGRSKPLRLAMLPDSVFAFASEVYGPQKAHNTLGRTYGGPDPRLAALLEAAA